MFLVVFRQKNLQAKQKLRVKILCLAMQEWRKKFPNCQKQLNRLKLLLHKARLLIICKYFNFVDNQHVRPSSNISCANPMKVSSNNESLTL